MTEIWSAVLVLSITGAIFAMVLYFVAQKFKVVEDPLIDEVAEVLPGANCGGCGKAGCRAMAEAFVKQGLGLFYYKKENSTLEEDFFVRTQNELIPVEVKSNDKRSKSLATFIRSENYCDIHQGIKLGDFNIGKAEGIITFPYFCAFMIKEYLKTWK